MQVFIEKEHKTVAVDDFSGTAGELLRRVGVNPETVIIVVDGLLVTEEVRVDGAAKVELLSVVSGG
ncbi:hypothetical protein GOV11_01945 [Candidatus Woesearchaeota archaeon]|nr:hypothetical protein [Candidatus Woesearchaeota archaeon]